ncbi:hypothetical protein PIB30_022668 [Stylosanthes scabra]|uniref:Uncharacterized protein n=1 Tax=Stylosanthes scabra TaxID=79078 RepID=A0ABU6V8R6_9FABA|nr:hypothetical protein [Stylosanthes scabra]
MAKGCYDFICRSILPTTNRSELTVERATDLSSSLPFPSIIVALCLDAKVTTLKDDTLINQEVPIVGAALVRTRETRAREENKGKAREVVPDSEEESEELVSGESEEW